jgi:hypothetical protein
MPGQPDQAPRNPVQQRLFELEQSPTDDQPAPLGSSPTKPAVPASPIEDPGSGFFAFVTHLIHQSGPFWRFLLLGWGTLILVVGLLVAAALIVGARMDDSLGVGFVTVVVAFAVAFARAILEGLSAQRGKKTPKKGDSGADV